MTTTIKNTNRETAPCSCCGAPVRSARNYGIGSGGSGQWVIYWTCGASIHYDGPSNLCPNRDERTTRDETTQLPEAEEPEPMSQTTENTATATVPTTKPSLEQEVAAWSKTDAELRAVVEATKGITIKDHIGGEKKGREAVHGALMTLVKSRTAIESRKAELKRPALDLCNLIETEAKRLLAIGAAREAELRKERDDWDTAQAKIEADRKEAERRAAHERLESRINAMIAAGLPPALGPATDLNDDQWGIFLGDAIEAKEAKDREDARIQAELDAAKAVADELTALGDECTIEEAMALTDEQRTHRLAVARKADHDRKEAARLKEEEAAAERQRIADEEKASRERLERGYRRGRELALLGSTGHEVEPLADMTEEAFAVALETARQEKADRDSRIAEERRVQDEKDAELARLRQAEDARLQQERDDLEKREQEAKAAAAKAEADAKAAREEAEREAETERLAALRPEREKIATWARATLDGMPSTPGIADLKLANQMTTTVDTIRNALLALESAMGGI